MKRKSTSSKKKTIRKKAVKKTVSKKKVAKKKASKRRVAKKVVTKKKVAKRKSAKKRIVKKSPSKKKVAKKRIVKKASKKRVAKPIKLDPDQYFFLYGGGILKSVAELKTALRSMDDVVFYHHVDEHKNDFASWIHSVFNKNALAKKIGQIKDRQEMIVAL